MPSEHFDDASDLYASEQSLSRRFHNNFPLFGALLGLAVFALQYAVFGLHWVLALPALATAYGLYLYLDVVVIDG